MSIIPDTRPKIQRSMVRDILAAKGVSDAKVTLVGIRGYFEDDMGKAGQNDRGMYDDALAVIGPGGVFRVFNANCDPSKWHKGMANLKAGVWQYKPGIHGLSKPPSRRYRAFVQAAKVTVVRDGRGDDTGMFGINIHRGGDYTTSSLGCQTIPPDQWLEFQPFLTGLLASAGQEVFNYVLVENDDLLKQVAAKPIASPWTVKMSDGAVWTPSDSHDGRPTAPVRRLAEALGGSVDWDKAPQVNDKTLTWFEMRGTESWGLVREIAEACGKTIAVTGHDVVIS